jgi:hypothetical protein
MAELSETDRQRIWRGLMRWWSANNVGNIYDTPFSKSEFRAAVDATDTWIDGNQSSFNVSLPQPFRNDATQAQKTLLFCVVAAMRVSPEFARRLVGEVD